MKQPDHKNNQTAPMDRLPRTKQARVCCVLRKHKHILPSTNLLTHKQTKEGKPCLRLGLFERRGMPAAKDEPSKHVHWEQPKTKKLPCTKRKPSPSPTLDQAPPTFLQSNPPYYNGIHCNQRDGTRWKWKCFGIHSRSCRTLSSFGLDSRRS